MSGKTNYEGLSVTATTQNRLSGFNGACPERSRRDPAGNMTQNGVQYFYDAENHMTSASGGYSYLYDGDGNRVEKCTAGTTAGTCATSPTGTLYWMGTGSSAISETNLAGAMQQEYIFFNGQRIARRDASNNVHYYHEDHLGSTSLVTDANGTMSACPTNSSLITGEDESDYYPYGGEIALCNRVPQNYKFTGKERDAESGLDDFGARYYASALGRFLRPDEPVDQHPADPQSWNLYSYVRNNPLVLTDPTGYYACGQMTAAQCTDFGIDLKQAQSALEGAYKAGTISSDQYNSATKALAAYGTLDDGNGVTVNVGATGGYPGNTKAEGGGEKTAANPTGQKIDVTLNKDLFNAGSSPGLLGAVAHEGSHVKDAEGWAKAGFTPGANPTSFKTEFAAYGVSITMGQAFGAQNLSGTNPVTRQRMPLWDSSKSSAENMLKRSSLIMNLYPNYKLKVFGENTKGSGFGTK